MCVCVCVCVYARVRACVRVYMCVGCHMIRIIYVLVACLHVCVCVFTGVSLCVGSQFGLTSGLTFVPRKGLLRSSSEKWPEQPSLRNMSEVGLQILLPTATYNSFLLALINTAVGSSFLCCMAVCDMLMFLPEN